MNTEIIKNKCEVLFTQYLKDNDLFVYCIDSRPKQYFIKKIAHHDTSPRYYQESILDQDMNSLGENHNFFSFLNEMLIKGEEDIVLYQAIKKTPKSKKGNYYIHINEIVNSLKSSEKILFKYISRANFLEHSWNVISKIFQLINKDEYKNKIIKSLSKTKAFRDAHVQSSVYDSIKDLVDDISNFQHYFDKVKNTKKEQSVVDHIDIPSAVLLRFTNAKLMGVNLNTQLTPDIILNKISNIGKILKQTYKNDLEIINIFLSYEPSDKYHTLSIICPQSYTELNQIIFEKIINDFSQMTNTTDIEKYYDSSFGMLVKECKAYQLQKHLKEELPINNAQAKRIINKV